MKLIEVCERQAAATFKETNGNTNKAVELLKDRTGAAEEQCRAALDTARRRGFIQDNES